MNGLTIYNPQKYYWMLILSVLFCLGGGCARVPKNKISLYQRSVVIENKQIEQNILSKAELSSIKSPDVDILFLKGTPYEMGFQHGRLLQKDIRANFSHIIKVIKWYATEDMIDEIYDLMAPYIPREEQEEMRGLAHGADIPLKLVHWIHTVPEISEYGKYERFRNRLTFLKGGSCSNIVAFGKSTKNGEMFQLRVLDWITLLGAHKYPAIIVREPDYGNASVSFSFAGFVGCVTGMNEKYMAFGEMGYANPPNETLEGIPFVFLYRKLMREADTLDDATRMVKNAVRTCSYVYMISDAKIPGSQTNAILYITDRDRVELHHENSYLEDEYKASRQFPAMDDILYGGPKAKAMHQALMTHYGDITPEILMEMTKSICRKDNIQNVVFKPKTLEAWVTYATSEKGDAGKACNQKWVYFNFGEALNRRRG